MTYNEDFNGVTGDVEYHCDALKYNSEAEKVVISFDEYGRMKKKETLKIKFPNLDEKDHDFPREYERIIHGISWQNDKFQTPMLIEWLQHIHIGPPFTLNIYKLNPFY